MDVNKFQQDKEIDAGRLDLECVLQAERFFYWAEAAIEAGHKVDRAKIHKEVVRAQLDMECRRDPAAFGLTKATEAAVSAAVECHEKYMNACDALIEAYKEHRLLQAAVNAMEQKKRMLESLITLHGQKYFAGPSVPRDLVADWKEHRDQLETDVNDQQKARARRRRQQK